MDCEGEDTNLCYKLAYWPSDYQTGEKILNHLSESLANDMDSHMNLLDLFDKIARKEEPDETGVAILDALLGKGSLEKVGVFALVRPEIISDVDKEIYENPDLFIVKVDQLSAHLYYQECLTWV